MVKRSNVERVAASTDIISLLESSSAQEDDADDDEDAGVKISKSDAEDSDFEVAAGPRRKPMLAGLSRKRMAVISDSSESELPPSSKKARKQVSKIAKASIPARNALVFTSSQPTVGCGSQNGTASQPLKPNSVAFGASTCVPVTSSLGGKGKHGTAVTAVPQTTATAGPGRKKKVEAGSKAVSTTEKPAAVAGRCGGRQMLLASLLPPVRPATQSSPPTSPAAPASDEDCFMLSPTADSNCSNAAVALSAPHAGKSMFVKFARSTKPQGATAAVNVAHATSTCKKQSETAREQAQPAAIICAGGAAVAATAVASVPATATSMSELWADKYAPKCGAALAVHAKKVQDVREWMEWQQPQSQRRHVGCLLILSGPAGSGKSTTVRALANELGYSLEEWTPPAPTLWEEHMYSRRQQGYGAPSYASKLAEFDAWVVQAKYPPLQVRSSASATAGESEQMVHQKPLMQQSIMTQLQPSTSQHPSMHHVSRPATSSQSVSPSASHLPSQQHILQSSQPFQHPHQQPLHSQPPVQSLRRQTQVLPRLLLIDDLPHASDTERRKRLAAALQDLVVTAGCPVVLIVTDSAGSGSNGHGRGGQKGPYGCAGGVAAAAGDGPKVLHKDLWLALQEAGATHIAFNPLTSLFIGKVLSRIALAENLALSQAAVLSIAESAEGDVRHAIQTLQLVFAGTAAAHTAPKTTKGAKGKRGAKAVKPPSLRGASKVLLPEEVAALRPTQRDAGIVLFHALGKLLYNKREDTVVQSTVRPSSAAILALADQEQQSATTKGADSEAGSSSGSGSKSRQCAGAERLQWTLQIPACHLRPPLPVDPEQLLVQSGLEPLPVAAFLHENYVHFIQDDAVDDVAAVAGYLSDAGLLCCYRNTTLSSSMWGGEEDSVGSSVMNAVAGSVATRGVLFANTHPAPKRWLPLKGSSTYAVEAACAANLTSLRDMSTTLACLPNSAFALGSGSSAALAPHALPWLRKLATVASYQWLSAALPPEWSQVWNGKVVVQGNDGSRSRANASALISMMAEVELEGDEVGTIAKDDPIES